MIIFFCEMNFISEKDTNHQTLRPYLDKDILVPSISTLKARIQSKETYTSNKRVKTFPNVLYYFLLLEKKSHLYFL